jgi:hypothetical protein
MGLGFRACCGCLELVYQDPIESCVCDEEERPIPFVSLSLSLFLIWDCEEHMVDGLSSG